MLVIMDNILNVITLMYTPLYLKGLSSHLEKKYGLTEVSKGGLAVLYLGERNMAFCKCRHQSAPMVTKLSHRRRWHGPMRRVTYPGCRLRLERKRNEKTAEN